MPDVTTNAVKSYQIGDRLFHQQKLVMGQVEHLSNKLSDLGQISTDKVAIAKLFLGRLDLLAVVLIPDGKTRADVVRMADEANGFKDVVEHLRLNMDWTLALEVASDFFVCNPISSLLIALDKVVKSVDLSQLKRAMGSNNFTPASVEVIQPDARSSAKV